jgi:hypothetical protein
MGNKLFIKREESEEEVSVQKWGVAVVKQQHNSSGVRFVAQ